MVGFAPRGPKHQVCICNAQMIPLVCLFLINFQLTAGFTASLRLVSLRFWTNQVLQDSAAGKQRQVLLSAFSLCCQSTHPFLRTACI